MSVYTHSCIYAYARSRIYVYARSRIYNFIYMYMQVPVCMHMQVLVCTCVYASSGMFLSTCTSRMCTFYILELVISDM